MIVDLMEAAKSFIICMASGQTRVLIFSKKKKRPKCHALLPTSSNMFVHVNRAHLLVMLWNICDGISLLHYSALTQLSDGSSCQLKMQQSWMRHKICNARHTAIILAKRDAAISTLREKRFRRMSRYSILRRDVNVMRMVLLILIKCV